MNDSLALTPELAAAGWALGPDGKAIHKALRFRGFRDAMAWMARAAFDAEHLNHHPEPVPMSRFAKTPQPPYYAVIFTAQRTDGDHGYGAMAEQMEQLALAQTGCLGAESTRDAEGLGITVSYWADEAAIAAWKAQAQHLVAQRLGRERWYSHYELRIARVERAYSGPEGPA
jgi:heme-degrading monooxygenase HmoA